MSLSDEYRKLRQQREGKTGEKTTSSGQKPLSQQYREKRAASFEREVGEAKLAMWRTMDQNARQASAYEKYKRTMSRIGAGDGNQAADDFSRMQQNARMRPVAERYMQAAVRAGDREMYDEGYRKYLATMDTLDREDAYNRKQESERRKRPSYLGSIRSADQLENDVRQLRGDLDRAESDLTASRNRGGRQETVDMDVPYEEEQARHLYLRRLTPEERAEELRPAPTEEEAQARYDEINARLAQTEQALSYRKMLDIYSMEEKVKARPTFAAEAEAGRQRWEANNAEAEKAAGGDIDVDMGDDTSGSAGYYRAMQKRREQANEAGRNADLDPGWMTDEQKQVYFALYATNPADAARYAEYKQQEMESQHWRKLQEASGKNFLSQAAAFVAGTGGQMIGGAANIIEALSGQPFGETSQSITKAANAMLGGGAEYWDRLSGTIDPDTPIVGDILGGKGLGALYQLASSIVQSGLTAKAAGAVSLAGGTGSEIVEKLGLALMGSQAASSDYTEALQRGMDRNTAMAHAFAAGVAEAAFEEISLDKLVTQYAAPELRKMGWRDLLRDGLRDYFQTAGIEASEEVMTSLANRVSDEIISQAGGYNTQIEQRAKELVALGVSERDAIDKANREWMVEVINDGLGGFIAGGFHTFANYAGAAISNQARSLAELPDYMPTATREASTEVKGTRGERRAFGRTVEESGGVEAVQQYASDNGIKAKAYNQDKQSKRQTGRLGRTAQDVTNHMIRQMEDKSLQEQAQVYTGLVEQYGEGIRETANEALRRASMKVMNETQSQRWQNKENFDYIEDPAARSVLEKTQDYLAFNEAMDRATSEGDEKAADYAIGTLRTKGITMEHTVTGEDGKTARVKIEGLTEDGKRVKLADGTTVKAEELKTDADTRDIFRRFTHDEMGSRANEIFNIMQAEQSAGRTTDLYGWAMDAANVYDQGRQGVITAEEAAKQAKNLSGEAVNLIYNMAREDVQKMDAKARAELQERLKVRQEGATGRKGSVTYSREIADRIARDEALGHEAERIRRFAEAFGVDVELFASELEDGKYKGKSGQYQDGKIWIDVNAGKFKAGDTANGMIYTMAHEMTHFMQEYNPEAYRGIKEFAMRQIQAQKGRDVLEGLIREKQRRHTGEKPLSRERAENEVAAEFCETMLTENTVLETLADENPGLFKTVLDWVKDFLAKIREKLTGLPAGSYESQVYRAMEKSLQETFGKMWAGGIAGAVQTHDAVGSLGDQMASDGNIHDITDQSGDVVGVQDGNGHAQFQLRTYDESGRKELIKYLNQQVKDEAITDTEAKSIRESVEEMYRAAMELTEESKEFKDWSFSDVQRNLAGKPIFSWLKSNTEYGWSMDASLVCIKRRTLDAVFDYMIRNHKLDNFDMAQQSIVAINDIIRSKGFEIACGLCYIDAKRYRAAMVAGGFCDLYNELVQSLVPKDKSIHIDYFNYGQDEHIVEKGNGIDTVPDSELDFSYLKKVMHDNGKKTVAYKTAKALMDNPKMRRKVRVSDFMSSTGFTEIGRLNPELRKLYNAKKGSGGPKATEADTQYLHEILSTKLDPEKYFNLGGLRVQSFSDYIPRLVFDYVEMIGDMAAKGLPSHAYSKELMFALQFGKTGMKINMSLIPNMVTGGVAPGLDANGNYAWRDGQSFGSTVYGLNEEQTKFLAKVLGEKVGDRLTAEQGFRLAKIIQGTEGYSSNCGTIAIGVSEKQIRKMLNDDDIRMVIPYHKSGLNHILASMMNVQGFTDYTSVQNTRKWNGKEWSKLPKNAKDFNINEYMHKHGVDAKTAADAYLKWCEQKGYKPKFDQFANEPGYYKVLIDFNAYDAISGDAAPQGSVHTDFPAAGDAFGDMKSLMRMALQGEDVLKGRQDKAVPEIVAAIEKTLPDLEQSIRSVKDEGEIVQRYEEWRDRNNIPRNQDRSYDLPSDAELIAGIDESQVTDKAGKDALREAKEAAKRIQDLEAKLEEARRQLKTTQRGYNTKGITGTISSIMNYFGMGDADGKGILKNAAATLRETYDAAIEQIDKGDNSAALEALYNGARQVAEYLMDNGTYREKVGYKWMGSLWTRAFASTEEARQNAVDEVVSRIYADFAENRYREAVQPTVADRIVERTENKYKPKLEAAEQANRELSRANEKLTRERDFYSRLEQENAKRATFLNEQLTETRQALKEESKANTQERKKLNAKAERLSEQLREAREQAKQWKAKAEHGGVLARQMAASKNRDIQAAKRQAEQARQAAVREKEAVVRKLEKQLQREQDILSGKLKPVAIQRMLKDARETAAKEMAEHKEEVYASRKQRHRESEIRNRIKSLHAEMQRELFNPREGHFIPQAFVRPVTELLQMIDTDRNAFRMRKLDERIADAKTAEQTEKLQGQRAELEQKQAKAADKIKAINSAYDQLKKDERYSMYYDETVKDMLVELAGTVGDKSLYELNGDELSDVYTVMRAMRTTMRNAIKADMYEKGKTIYEAGDRLIDELRRSGGPHRFRLFEKYHMTQLSAERAFNRFGGYQKDSGWNRLYKMLDDAQLKMINLEMQGTRIFDPVLKSKEAFARAQDLTSTKEKDLVDVGLKDEDGKAVKITRGMMLALYMHMQNEQNMRHVMYGGLTLPDLSGYYKGAENAWGRKSVSIPALGARVSNLDQLLDEIGEEGVSERYKAEEEAVREMFDSVRAAIEKEMTDYDRKWIELSREFFDGFSRRVLNETTNSMYGFSKARVDNYFPIVTDKNFLKKDFDSIQRNVSLENAGFMKERVKAANPILLEDLTRTVNRQIGNVSRYAGLTEAIKTFNAIYNAQKKGNTTSVKKAMNNAYEDVGQKYVENLITDMVGGRQEPANFLDRVRGMYAQGVLSANIPVTIKQAASFPTAAATVGWAPLRKALAKGGRKGRVISRADRALIDTYSPLLWYRAKGAIDTEIGDMAHAQDWTKKAKWLMGWIEKADIATVGRLWYAAQYYVDKNFPGLEKGTEAQIKAGESAYYRKVAEVFNKIVEDTQPNYTVLQRPDILRNPSKLVKSLVMFSTQRLQNANILIDAAAEYNAMRQQDRRGSTEQTRAARKAAKAKLTNAITSQVASTIVLNVMTLAAGAFLHRMNPWRDDDDELTKESIMEEYLNGLLSTVSGSFLLGTETYEAIHAILTGSKYYENDVGGISTINSVLKSVVDFGQDAVKLVSDEDFSLEKLKDKAWKNLYSTAGNLSQITGVPVQNIWKILEGAYRHGEDIVNGEFFSFESGVTRKAATNARRYWEAYEAGDAEKMGAVLAEMRDNYKADGKSEKKTEELVRNAVGKLVTEAWDSEEIDLAEAEKRLEQTGLFDEEKLSSRVLGFVREEVTAGSLSDESALAYLSKYKPNKKESENWATLQEWKARGSYAEEYRSEHGDEDEVDFEDFNFEQYGDVFAAVEAGKDLGAASKDLLAHGYTEKQIRDAAVDHVRELLKDGKVSDSKAVSLVQKYKQIKEDGTYRPATADEAWFTVREWSANNAHAGDEDYSYKKYEDVYKAIDGGLSISTAVKALTDHGVKEEDVKEKIKGYLKKQYLAGAYSESQIKEHWKRYLNTSATEAKQVARWLELQRKNPKLEISQARADSYYDGTTKTRENGHASAQAAGMTIQQYLEAKEILSKVKGVDEDGNGRTDDGSTEIAYIHAIAKMNLTSGQKWAIYYEKYKGANRKKGIWPTW